MEIFHPAASELRTRDVRLLRRRGEPGGVPPAGAPPGQRRGCQQHQQMDRHRLHLLPHRRLHERLLLGPLHHLRHLPDDLCHGAGDTVAGVVVPAGEAVRVWRPGDALRPAVDGGGGAVLPVDVHDRVRQRRVPAVHRDAGVGPVRRDGPGRGALQGGLLQLLLPGAQRGLPLLQHGAGLLRGRRPVGHGLLGLGRRRGAGARALPPRHPQLPLLQAQRQPADPHRPGARRRVPQVAHRRARPRRAAPRAGRRRVLQGGGYPEDPAQRPAQVSRQGGDGDRGGVPRSGEPKEPVEALHGDAGGGGEVHPEDAAHLAVHDRLLCGVHADGLPVRGARHHHEHQHRVVPRAGGEHVGVRHPQRAGVHRHLPSRAGAGHGEAVWEPAGAYGAATHGRRARDRHVGDGGGGRGGGGAAEAGARVRAGRAELPERAVAGAAVRADRSLGGVHVRGAAGVLQRAGARRREELRQLAVHGVHLARELRQHHAGQRGHQPHRRGQAARVDPGEPQLWAPRQVLLPPRGALARRPRRLRGLRDVVQGHQARQQRRGGKGAHARLGLSACEVFMWACHRLVPTYWTGYFISCSVLIISVCDHWICPAHAVSVSRFQLQEYQSMSCKFRVS